MYPNPVFDKIALDLITVAAFIISAFQPQCKGNTRKGVFLVSIDIAIEFDIIVDAANI